ncbi:MAG: DUF2723 domain-containing protein [Candidatus Kapabacteria bacterium]|nr:DUF2723 domain-containing protein [Candidatus Kapabacteria bacterium]
MRNQHTLASVALGLVAAIVYLLTRVPGLYYTDTGELAAACATLGIAHPTGYPLFTLIGHAWTLLPWASAITGLTIMNALVVAAGVTMLCLAAADMLRLAGFAQGRPTTFAAVAAVGLFAFGGIAWDSATAFEVYGLNILLLASTLFCTLRSSVDTTRARQWSVLAGIHAGLMLTNHVSSVFLMPGLLLLWIMTWPTPAERKTWKAVATVVIPAVAALALYAYLPLRSGQHPPIDWGGTHASWHHFWYHVRGTQFGVWLFSDADAAKRNLGIVGQATADMTLYVGLALFGAGLSVGLGKARRIGLGLLVIAMGNLGISLGYAIPDIESYFLPTLMVVSLFMAIGLRRLLDAQRLQQLAPAVLALPLISIGLGWTDHDRSTHRGVESYTRWVMDNAEPNAVIISHQWDYFCSAFWYLQTVEGERPDITLVDKELLRRTWYLPYLQRRYPTTMSGVKGAADAFLPWLERFETEGEAFTQDRRAVRTIQERFVGVLNAVLAANDGRPLYVTPELLSEEAGFAAGYVAVPVGPLIRLQRSTAPVQGTNMQQLSTLAESLRGRTERLDIGMREMTSAGIAQSAIYALQGRNDTTTFRALRQKARLVDPRGRNTMYLDGILP